MFRQYIFLYPWVCWALPQHVNTCVVWCSLVTSSLTSSFMHLGELMMVSLYNTNDEGSLFEVGVFSCFDQICCYMV